MEILQNSGLVLIGFIGLLAGADLLVRGASGIARSLGVPSMVVGLTIVAYGTSMPEFMASFMAVKEGAAGIALGNVLGSNICNIALVMGVAGMLTVVRVERDVYRRQLPITIGMTVVLALFLAVGGSINRFEGLALFAGIVVYTVWNFRRSRGTRLSAEENKSGDVFQRHAFVALTAIIAGSVFLFFGGKWVVDGATAIAHHFSVPDRIIGATLVALGTSLPELITTVVGIMKGETDLGVGNAIGSCIFNILMVIGGTAVYRPIHGSIQQYWLEFTFALLVLVVLYPMAARKRELNRKHGVVLAAMYVLFILLVC